MSLQIPRIERQDMTTYGTLLPIRQPSRQIDPPRHDAIHLASAFPCRYLLNPASCVYTFLASIALGLGSPCDHKLRAPAPPIRTPCAIPNLHNQSRKTQMEEMRPLGYLTI